MRDLVHAMYYFGLVLLPFVSNAQKNHEINAATWAQRENGMDAKYVQ
jgi:hypothetical protein